MEKFLKIANKCFDRIVALMILIVLLYAGYCIWDNNQIYKNAAKMWEIDKEKVMAADPEYSESENIIAWINLINTNIDYPVVQGRNNTEYLTKDIDGNYSLSGSIYLDSRNNKDFSDAYSIIYGHNMDRHMMFGDLKEFLDEDYFQEHSVMTISLKDENTTNNDYSIVAVLRVTDNQTILMDIENYSLEEFFEYIKNNAIHYNADTLEKVKDVNLLASFVSLVTCSSGHTYEKIVVVAVRTEEKIISEPQIPIDSEVDTSIPVNNPKTGNSGALRYIVLFSVSVITMLKSKKRREDYEK